MYDARVPQRITVAAGAAYTLTSTGVATSNVVYIEDCQVTRLCAYVTTAVVSTGTVTVQFLYRPVYGSASGQVTLGTIVLPATAAVDKVYYKDITPYNLPAGSQVVFNTSVAAAGGGAAGAAIFDIIANFDPEVAANDAKFIASA